MLDLKNLHNKYFLMRHGESKANAAGIILSSLADGQTDAFGLTDKGFEQAKQAAQQADFLNSDTIIYSSPFSRCRQTTEVVKEVLGVKSDIVFDERMRERWFGELEKQADTTYQKVWDHDHQDFNHRKYDVESVAEVAQRMREVIQDLEKQHSGKTILLVAHGDPLQILLSSFNPALYLKHRMVEHLEKAEIRELK